MPVNHFSEVRSQVDVDITWPRRKLTHAEVESGQKEMGQSAPVGQFLTIHSYVVPNRRPIVLGGVLDLRTTYTKRKLSLQQLWALQLFAKWANLKGVQLGGNPERRPIELVRESHLYMVVCRCS